MNTRIAALLVGGYLACLPMAVGAQEAGSTQLAISVSELREVALGWSVKKTILGQDVYNEADEKVGSVDDIIISPNNKVSYAIVNAGGFLKVAKHDVAIPVALIDLVEDKLVIPGATREALKEAPAFEYAK